jgi:hypothetical protein
MVQKRARSKFLKIMVLQKLTCGKLMKGSGMKLEK